MSGLAADAILAQGSRVSPAGSQQLLDQLHSLKAEVLVPEEANALRLRKVPGDSPAATISRFMVLTEQAESTIRQAIHRGMAEPGLMFSPEVYQQADGAVSELEQATHALDLSQVPVVLRPMTGVGMMLMLRSLLKYDLSQTSDQPIPDASDVRRQGLTNWTIPDTPITLTALKSNPTEARQACGRCSPGDFLFSADTLAEVPDDFAQIFSGNPKLQRQFGADLYTYWALTPGGAIPPKLFLIQPLALRRFLLITWCGQSLLQWLFLIPGTLLGLAAMGWWLWKLRLWSKQGGELKGRLQHVLGVLALLPLLLLVWAWQWFAIDWVNLYGSRQVVTLVIVRIAEGVLLALLAYQTAEACGQLIIQSRRPDPAGKLVLYRRKGAGQIMTVARVTGLLIAAVVLIQTGRDLGLTSLTLLGLASVPALAVSLGTQELIRDIADGFSLLFDGQLQMGDRCTVATSKSGVIKGQIASLGMRSTRIRQEDGAMLSLPNSQVAGSVVTNFRFRDADLLQLSLPIAPELLRRTQQLLEEARQLVADCSELSSGSTELEATDTGWNLLLSGRWDNSLAKDDLSAAKQRLYLRLIQLTHPDS
ncbi:MAG: mechanosensitive ion channel domain-containing protein [Synechococcaceae cyanobacterium]|jgi:small-conductance mechanosensitive channel